MNKTIIAVDFDGTLAMYDGYKGPEHVGEPVPKMLDLVKGWLTSGKTVKIMTARVNPKDKDAGLARKAIERWCEKYLGMVLPITHEKDRWMTVLYDDRARQVEKNTGRIVGYND